MKFSNKILLTTDTGKSMALVPLDLSAAFDLVDHDIHLETCVGLRGTALKWFRSYLLNRWLTVHLGHHSYSSIPLVFPKYLFSLYMLPLVSIFDSRGVSFHLYANDTQIYLPLYRNNKNSLQPLFDYLFELKLCLSRNFLNLNKKKAGLFFFGPKENSIFEYNLCFLSS